MYCGKRKRGGERSGRGSELGWAHVKKRQGVENDVDQREERKQNRRPSYLANELMGRVDVLVLKMLSIFGSLKADD
jgi:hypothetical protein